MLSLGSLLRFAYFRLPMMVENSTSSPSVLAQTTLDCGRPSGSIVATVAWLRPSNSSRARSGSSAMDTSSRSLAHHVTHPCARRIISDDVVRFRTRIPARILDLDRPSLTRTHTYPGFVDLESDI